MYRNVVTEMSPDRNGPKSRAPDKNNQDLKHLAEGEYVKLSSLSTVSRFAKHPEMFQFLSILFLKFHLFIKDFILTLLFFLRFFPINNKHTTYRWKSAVFGPLCTVGQICGFCSKNMHVDPKNSNILPKLTVANQPIRKHKDLNVAFKQCWFSI